MQAKVIYINGYEEVKPVVKKVSKKKGRRVIAIGFAVIMLVVGYGKLLKVTYNHGQNKLQKQLSTYEKVEVVVGKGETAWELQKELTPNEDINEMLHLAKKENGKSMGAIREGEVITLFKK